jgi:hypothetical protein
MASKKSKNKMTKEEYNKEFAHLNTLLFYTVKQIQGKWLEGDKIFEDQADRIRKEIKALKANR